MLNEAIGEPSSRYASVTNRSSARVIVISFLCGNLELALKSSLSFPLPAASPSSTSSPPASRMLIARGKASVIAKSRSRKDVESFAAYSVAPSAAASSPLIDASSCGRPKNSLAISLTRGMRVAPPTTSTRCTSSLVRLACRSASASGARSRAHSPAASARSSKSLREMTIRRSRSSCTDSTATWNCWLAERTSFTRSASLRSLPMARECLRTSSPLSCSLNLSARMSSTTWSKKRPPSVSSHATPSTLIAPVVLFFFPTVVEKETTETLKLVAPRS
mmetsp:Transcript_14318/g.30306  ORF Transcript_14318/g.30306 Transcript_14318/m.30306 type:complete len:277 (-) Transcript_14318:669-1499(-)